MEEGVIIKGIKNDEGKEYSTETMSVVNCGHSVPCPSYASHNQPLDYLLPPKSLLS